jgi:hypothetical protein
MLTEYWKAFLEPYAGLPAHLSRQSLEFGLEPADGGLYFLCRIVLYCMSLVSPYVPL